MPQPRLLVEHNPVLASQWRHARNAELGLDLATIAVSSGKKAWWICNTCAYEWLATVASRNQGRGCGRCAGRVVSEENSLAGNYPAIAAEFHPVKNSKSVDQISWKTSTNHWWQCLIDPAHEWQTSPRNRVLQGDGCPFCGGRFPTAEWNLGVIYPQVAAEFDLEANYPLTPRDFTPKSSKKVWWKCAAGHRSHLSPCGRVHSDGRFIECGKCGRHVSTPETCILVTHPDVAAEFDREKNVVPIEEVLSGSTTKRWWRCKARGHSWESSAASRTRRTRPGGCPECSPTPRTSLIERQLREHFKQDNAVMGISDAYNTSLPVPSGKHSSMQVDICGEYAGAPVVIEWDSWWWHSGLGTKEPYEVREERDLRKTLALLKAGYLVVRIREERNDVSLPILEAEHENLFQLHYNYLRDGTAFDPMLRVVYAWLTARTLPVVG